MVDRSLTKSERRILRVLETAPRWSEEYNGTRVLVRLTHRGFRTVVGRLADRNMLAESFEPHRLNLTFGGSMALKEAA